MDAAKSHTSATKQAAKSTKPPSVNSPSTNCNRWGICEHTRTTCPTRSRGPEPPYTHHKNGTHPKSTRLRMRTQRTRKSDVGNPVSTSGRNHHPVIPREETVMLTIKPSAYWNIKPQTMLKDLKVGDTFITHCPSPTEKNPDVGVYMKIPHIGKSNTNVILFNGTKMFRLDEDTIVYKVHCSLTWSLAASDA